MAQSKAAAGIENSYQGTGLNEADIQGERKQYGFNEIPEKHVDPVMGTLNCSQYRSCYPDGCLWLGHGRGFLAADCGAVCCHAFGHADLGWPESSVLQSHGHFGNRTTLTQTRAIVWSEFRMMRIEEELGKAAVCRG